MKRDLYCGVDIGASATKVVLVDADGETVARSIRHSGIDYEETARICRDEAIEIAGEGRLAGVVSTGYGRHNVTFAGGASTEIQCHATGCYHLIPEPLTVVDIGGQDNKVILLDERGKRVEFKMNRKCAAGTGAFLEEIALRLDLDPSDMDGLARSTESSVRLSSFCTVFAKTEILAHLRQGVPVGEIVRGAFRSVVNRVVEMDPLQGKVALVGGVVAHNPTIAEILGERLGREVVVPPYPQFTGALGAALIAARRAVAVSETQEEKNDA